MGAAEGNNPKINFFDKLLKSFSLILIVIYCPFAIAAMLNGPFGTSYNTMVVCIFISMGLCTLVSSIYAKISLVLAPGIGLATFYSSLYTSGQANNVMIASALAGVVTFCLSLKPKSASKTLREIFLNKIPEEAKIGIRGSVGAILISTALKQIASADIRIGDASFKVMSGDTIYATPFILFLVSTALIYTFTCLDKALTGNESRKKVLLSLLFKSMHVFIPFMLYFVACFWGKIGTGTVVNSIVQPTFFESKFHFFAFIGYYFIIQFIIIVDIPGSLYDIARQVPLTESDTADGNADKYLIDKSFRISSLAAIFNAIFSISPSVYYAENYILFQSKFHKDERMNVSVYIKNKVIGVICSCIFLSFAVFFYFFNLESNISNIIKFMVAPNIFSLGIHLLSKSFYTENKQHTKEEHTKEEKQIAYYKFAPAAFSIIMTPMFSFEFTIPTCIFFASLIHIVEHINVLQNDISELIFYAAILIFSGITFVSFILPCYFP